MCVNSKCVPVTEEPEHCHCNGHGMCNQIGECHCDVGWAPPDCKKRGLGGSLSNGPAVIRADNILWIVGK